ncbi:MAG: glutaminyl-peptide cyclotransferase [Bacteroidales bacterium]
MKICNITLIILSAVLTSGSCDRGTGETGQKRLRTSNEVKITGMELPDGVKFTTGDDITITINAPDTLVIDSIQVFLGGKPAGVFQVEDKISLSTAGVNPGKKGLRTRIYFDNEKSDTHSVQVELLSDIEPVAYRYRVVNTFSHDVGAYTQGLLYYDGWLYEGTGNRNQSTIRKVRLSNGEVIQIRNNASEIFGEGITIFDGKIYQLTYKSQICFVYDLNTFNEIQRFYFQNKEGWGLTNTEEELIMSDGTHILYFIDPGMFTVKRQLEVYNNKGPVHDLNELEYINGKIYANRYYTDEIVIIDPETGKEEGRVNMKGILPLEERKQSTDVLNGIAWDSKENRIFVTGKYWPKLFEIQIVPAGI